MTDECPCCLGDPDLVAEEIMRLRGVVGAVQRCVKDWAHGKDARAVCAHVDIIVNPLGGYVVSTGMPAGIWLTKFGMVVSDYFGHECYHVGSSLFSKDWRDVDVRLILPDTEFSALFGSVHAAAETCPALAAVTLAFSALGQQMTGLPIDFQIQTLTHANEKYPHNRSPLIEYPGSAVLAECPCCLGDPNTVCDACEQHSCWAGRFMCDEAQTAGAAESRAGFLPHPSEHATGSLPPVSRAASVPHVGNTADSTRKGSP
jgi:hypothetical protein